MYHNPSDEPVRIKLDPSFGYGAVFRQLELAFSWGSSPKGLELDLSGLRALDAEALRLIEQAFERSRKGGVALLLKGLSAELEGDLAGSSFGRELRAAEPA